MSDDTETIINITERLETLESWKTKADLTLFLWALVSQTLGANIIQLETRITELEDMHNSQDQGDNK